MLDLKRALKILKLPDLSDGTALKAAFRRAVLDVHPDLHPDDPDAERRMQEVIAAQRAVEAAMQDPLERLAAMLRRGGFAEAMRLAQKLLAGQPDAVSLRMLYAQALFGMGHHDATVRQTLQVLGQETRLDAYLLLAQAFQALGLKKRAQEALRHARTLGGPDAEAQIEALFQAPPRRQGKARGDWLRAALGAGSGLLLGGPVGGAIGLACGLYLSGKAAGEKDDATS